MGNGAVSKSRSMSNSSDEEDSSRRRATIGSMSENVSRPEIARRKALTRSLGVPHHTHYIFSSFRFVRSIGNGRMSKVHLAYSMKLAAKVGLPRCAVKEVSAGSLSTQHLQEFRYELNLLSNLKHPNLPRIHSVYDTYGTESHVGKSGNNRSIVYVVMDHLNGGELLPALCRQRQYLESDA
eukprot:gene18814-22050_t